MSNPAVMTFEYLVDKERIDLSFNSLHDGNMDILVQVLHQSTVLEELNLWSNRIALTADKFTNALAQNKTLRVLSLGSNQIASAGMERLADALKANVALQELHLGDNFMGNDGAKSFADALIVNEALQTISIYGNNIGDIGIQSLAASFKENQTLRVIWLHGNNIGNDGAQSLVDALQVNHTIEKIFLIGNTKITNKRNEEEIDYMLVDSGGRKKRAAEARRAVDEVAILAAQREQEEMDARKKVALEATHTKLAMLKAALTKKNGELAAQEKEIASLKTMVLENQNREDYEIAALKQAILIENWRKAATNSTSEVVKDLMGLSSKKDSKSEQPIAATGESAFEDARDDIMDNDPLILHAVASIE